MTPLDVIRQSLSTSSAVDGTFTFPTILIDKSRERYPAINSADSALGYYRSVGMLGERSTKNEFGYGAIFRSLTSEPPWVESIRMEEMEEISPERDSQLRPFARHVQETSDDSLFQRFRHYLRKRNAIIKGITGVNPLSSARRKQCGLPTELDEFKNLVGLARLLGTDLAFDLYRLLLCEFGADSSGIEVATGAPDLFLWTHSGDRGFWFFSEVKARGDYLSETQKDWTIRNCPLLQGHFVLTILA